MKKRTKRLPLLMMSCMFLFAVNITAIAQEIRITGKIKSEKNEPQEGVTIEVKGANRQTISDADGNFVIVVPAAGSRLVFTAVGFETQEVALGGNTNINVTLQEKQSSMNEVVVIGYSARRRVTLTGSVSTMETRDLTNRPVPQLSQALQGKMPGVTVTQNFGLPGSDNGTIRIRGIGTFSNANPLVLIDGVEGNLNDIAPNDVESISVLKDASASIYGSRASNGVVLVTTKRGRLNQDLSVAYNGIYGHQKATGIPELVDGATYMMLRNEYQTNANLAPIYTQQQIDEYRQKVGTANFFNTNWYDVAMRDNAPHQQHNLTLRGGGAKISSLVSLSYVDQDALVARSGLTRYSIRVNTNYQATKRLSFVLDAFLRREQNDRPNVPGGGSGSGITELFKMMADIPNIYPALWPDGTYGEGWQGANPLAFIEVGGRNNQLSSRIQLNLRGKYELFEGVSIEGAYAPKYLSSFGKTTTKVFPFRRLDGSMGTFPNSPSDLSNSYGRSTEDFLQGILRFNRKFGEHTVSAFAATEYLNFHGDGFSAYQRNFLLPDYEVLGTGSSDPTDRNIGGNATEWTLLSYFGSVNYSFKDKYLLQFDLRRDGSSRFAPQNRWGLFPAVSAGWVISEESFFPKSNILSYLKLRGSWGKMGQQDILNDNYPYLATLSVGGGYGFVFNNNLQSGAQQTVLNNPDVTWEKTTTINAAVDFTMFRNRLSGTIEVYKRTTTDLLYTRNIPAIIGLSSTVQNVASMENVGFDLQLGWRDRIGDFRYSVDLNFSDARNEITDLGGKPVFARNSLFVGEEFQAFWGYESLGIYKSADELAKFPPMNPNVKVGDLIYRDRNGDGKINQDDKTIIGSNIPRYNYGVTFDVGYKNFDLNVFFQGVGKKSLYYLDNSADYGGNYYTFQLGRYSPNDPSTHANATFPRINGSGTNLEDNSFYLYNAAYLRCKNLMIGYSLPENILNRTGLKRARFFVSGTNLFTFDKLPVNTIDPEAPNSNLGPTYYPNVKVISVGLDIQF